MSRAISSFVRKGRSRCLTKLNEIELSSQSRKISSMYVSVMTVVEMYSVADEIQLIFASK